MNENLNYYELLGIKKNATTEEIRKAYRLQAKKWHPDINKDPLAKEITIKLNEAKETLLDDLKRADYDKYLENLNNPKYQNLKEKEHHKQHNQSSTNYQKEYHTNENYTKMYTKWEYFITYLKYYQTPLPRKILAIILVLLETLLCSILQIINYILALIIYYIGSLISYLSSITLVIYIIYLVFNLTQSTTQSPTTVLDWLKSIGIILICIFISLSPGYILKLLVEKTPIYFSNLNIYLFKKSVGYKEI